MLCIDQYMFVTNLKNNVMKFNSEQEKYIKIELENIIQYFSTSKAELYTYHITNNNIIGDLFEIIDKTCYELCFIYNYNLNSTIHTQYYFYDNYFLIKFNQSDLDYNSEQEFDDTFDD